MEWQHGEVHWTELATRDVTATRAYYTEVCGWSWSEMPMPDGTYHVAMMGEQMVCGLYDMSDTPGMENVPAHWLTIFAVTDVESAVEATKAQGGQILRAPFDVPEVGRIAIVTDPSGAALGLMTPSG
ncbi:VOC family protein [Primorskyibacter sp. S187A]|uniref:VOC family protein n=1 Tax=Primorskyibacter sp. S187A TaxID=3415130 RepID=UPI003C7B2BD0